MTPGDVCTYVFVRLVWLVQTGDFGSLIMVLDTLYMTAAGTTLTADLQREINDTRVLKGQALIQLGYFDSADDTFTGTDCVLYNGCGRTGRCQWQCVGGDPAWPRHRLRRL